MTTSPDRPAARNRERVPFSAPSEPVEYEHTTKGRQLCQECGEWQYLRRKVGSSGPFSFTSKCEVCGYA